MRNRREEDNSGEQAVDEEVYFHQVEDKSDPKSYSYFPVIRNLFYAVIVSCLIALFFILVVLDSNDMNTNSEATSPVVALQDKCKDEWAPDILVGRCFGLKTHTEYPVFRDISVVENSEHCKRLCCELGDECISWQFWIGIKLCKLGGPVRIGAESAKTANWCEPDPPLHWQGKRVAFQNGSNTEIGQNLTTQCFGLGPAKFKTVSGERVALTISECSTACLNTPGCRMWQAHDSRGCFYSTSKSLYCEPYDGVYDGGRKKIARAGEVPHEKRVLFI
mmetsp:Transcript_10764/g.16366  ORF Transcript_10764/g.16366 Transcript_10764/m.16366 type:complete len:277 (+) Transcript_10764:63-893(+)